MLMIAFDASPLKLWPAQPVLKRGRFDIGRRPDKISAFDTFAFALLKHRDHRFRRRVRCL